MTAKAYLDPIEVDSLEKVTGNLRDRLFIRLLSHLGCRIAKAQALTVDDINFQQATGNGSSDNKGSGDKHHRLYVPMRAFRPGDATLAPGAPATSLFPFARTAQEHRRSQRLLANQPPKAIAANAAMAPPMMTA
jgi:integrase